MSSLADGQHRDPEALLHFQQFADATDEAFLLVDVVEESILYRNRAACELLGSKSDSLRSFLESIHPEDRPNLDGAPQRRDLELRFSFPAGELRWFGVRLFPAGEEASRLAILARDVSEHKKLEAQFLRAQRMESIGTLASGIAHDLNNVLTPILMGLDLLKLSCEEDGEILDSLEQSARRGADLVRQILAFAQGVEGRRSRIQPRDLALGLERLMRETLPKSVTFELDIPEEIWCVAGDPTQLHQILLNLCVNSADAMPSGGKLTLSVGNQNLDAHDSGMNPRAQPGRYVVFEVADSGHGISESNLGRVFDPFFTTKELGGGTGLGLATTQALVKSHGGFVNLYSQEGRGTVVKVYLPALEGTPTPLTPDLCEALPRGQGNLVLVIDDESAVRMVTQQTLEAFGYRVIVAEDGAQGVALYAAQHDEIKIVITDMMMPVMDGFATIHALRRINPEVRIIAVSGLTANRSMSRAVEAGVQDFLPKPYTAEVLLKTLGQALKKAAK